LPAEGCRSKVAYNRHRQTLRFTIPKPRDQSAGCWEPGEAKLSGCMHRRELAYCRSSWRSMCPTAVGEGAVESCPRLNGRKQLRIFVLPSIFGITRFIPYHQLRCERFYGNTAVLSCFQFKARLS